MCWNKGRLCWKIAKLFYFCHLKKLVRPETFGPYYVYLLFNQRWSLPLRLQVSHCSAVRIMCDVPSTAVFCSASIQCVPGMASKPFFQPFLTTPVAPVITSTIIHFMFHIRFVSTYKLLYLVSFLLPFAWYFCLRVLQHLSLCMFSLSVFNY